MCPERPQGSANGGERHRWWGWGGGIGHPLPRLGSRGWSTRCSSRSEITAWLELTLAVPLPHLSLPPLSIRLDQLSRGSERPLHWCKVPEPSWWYSWLHACKSGFPLPPNPRQRTHRINKIRNGKSLKCPLPAETRRKLAKPIQFLFLQQKDVLRRQGSGRSAGSQDGLGRRL